MFHLSDSCNRFNEFFSFQWIWIGPKLIFTTTPSFISLNAITWIQPQDARTISSSNIKLCFQRIAKDALFKTPHFESHRQGLVWPPVTGKGGAEDIGGTWEDRVKRYWKLDIYYKQRNYEKICTHIDKGYLSMVLLSRDYLCLLLPIMSFCWLVCFWGCSYPYWAVSDFFFIGPVLTSSPGCSARISFTCLSAHHLTIDIFTIF